MTEPTATGVSVEPPRRGPNACVHLGDRRPGWAACLQRAFRCDHFEEPVTVGEVAGYRSCAGCPAYEKKET